MSLEELQQHSDLGPSGAPRWINCPGSVNASKGITDKSSFFAEEGTFAHYISELAREQSVPAKDLIGTASDDGKFECDADMANHVQYFLDYEAQYEAEVRLVEARVNYDAWVDGGFGTLDAGLLNDGTAIIIDLKYGKGIQVFAERNYQLMLYALGLYQEHSDLYDFDEFKLCICQPRLDWIDEWTISVEELLTWAEEVVEPAADETAREDARFKEGEWCSKNFCKIRSTCKVRAAAYNEMMLDEISDIRDPAEMENDELGELASLIPLMLKWGADVMQRVESLVSKGAEIMDAKGLPFKMVAGRGSRAWKDAVAAERAMKNNKIKSADMFAPRKILTPPAFEKIHGADHVVMKKHCLKSQGKPTLVPGSDPRPAFKISADEMKVIEDE